MHPRISRRTRVKRERSRIGRRAAHPGYACSNHRNAVQLAKLVAQPRARGPLHRVKQQRSERDHQHDGRRIRGALCRTRPRAHSHPLPEPPHQEKDGEVDHVDGIGNLAHPHERPTAQDLRPIGVRRCRAEDREGKQGDQPEISPAAGCTEQKQQERGRGEPVTAVSRQPRAQTDCAAECCPAQELPGHAGQAPARRPMS